MARNRILVTFAGLLLFGGLVFGRAASAHEFRTSTNTSVAQGEVIDNSLFIAGNAVNIDGEVFGDVFCAGQTVTVTGRVHGDILCGGQTIRISGQVDGDVRLAGQSVSVSSRITGNATIAGQSFTLDATGSVDGDITIGANDTTLNGKIGRDLALGGTTVTISSEVGRNIKGDVAQLQLTKTASVKGTINYTSKNELNKADGAQVTGAITRTAPKEADAPKRGAVFGFTVMWFLYWFFAMLAIALSLALLFPSLLHNITGRALPRPWKALLVGLLAGLAVPVTLVILMVTVIGIPLALVLGLLWLVIVLVSIPTTGYYAGRVLVPRAQNAPYIMFVGASLLTVVYFIPFIGFIAFLLSVWLGSGMILLELMRRTPRPVHKVEPHTTGNSSPKPQKKSDEKTTH